jgi:beta-lactamase class A
MIRSKAFLRHPIRKVCLLFFSLLLFGTHGLTQDFRSEISQIINSVKAAVGVGIKHLESGDTITFSGRKRFPMQSVFKFPLAIAVLKQVDKGNLSLEQKVPIETENFIPNTWSPIAEKYPNGGVDLTLRELLSYTVSQSDNNGCDILFRLLGGPAKVNEYFQGLGLKGMSIVNTEAEMHRRWDAQFNNFAEPLAMVKLLEMFHQEKLLSKSSQDILLDMMLKTITGRKRLKGMLPEDTDVAHRTGMSSTNDQGVRAALNDVGIVTLPNGSHFAIAVFISNTKEETSKLEELIAKISKATFDHYLSKQ